MKSKLIPFKKNIPSAIPAPVSKGPLKSDDGEILDHGDLGALCYEIYARGVIHIFERKDGVPEPKQFKKDTNLFETELKKIDFENLDNEASIKGSGSNDDLVFIKGVDGEIRISLKKKSFKVVEMLHEIIQKGKKIIEK